MSPDDKAKQKNMHENAHDPWQRGAEELDLSLDHALQEGLRQTQHALRSSAEDVLNRLQREVERHRGTEEEDAGRSRLELESELEEARQELKRAETDRERWAEAREQLAEAETEIMRMAESMEVSKRETLRTLEEGKASREALSATLRAREAELADCQQSLAERSAEFSDSAKDQVRLNDRLRELEEELSSARAELLAARASLADDDGGDGDPLTLRGRAIERSLFRLNDAAGSLGKTFLDPEQEKLVSTLKQRAMQLTGSLGTILALRMMDAGELVIASEPMAPADLLLNLRELHAGNAAAKSLNLKLEIAPDCPAEVLADEDRLTLVLSCLLDNAISCASSGSITLGLSHEDDRLCFSVSDQGRGLPEDLAQKIESGKLEIETPAPGAGLGLTLAARLLRAMDSSLRLGAQRGSGSRFEFDLAVGSPVVLGA